MKNKTQELINKLSKIEVSEENKQIIYEVCEQLAFLHNKLNNKKDN